MDVLYRAFANWIPLFAEIGGRFLYHKDSFGNHVGYHYQSGKHIPLLVEIGGIERISEKNIDGRHTGFYPTGMEALKFLINLDDQECHTGCDV